jgi:hypothetical protein
LADAWGLLLDLESRGESSWRHGTGIESSILGVLFRDK